MKQTLQILEGVLSPVQQVDSCFRFIYHIIQLRNSNHFLTILYCSLHKSDCGSGMSTLPPIVPMCTVAHHPHSACSLYVTKLIFILQLLSVLDHQTATRYDGQIFEALHFCLTSSPLTCIIIGLSQLCEKS